MSISMCGFYPVTHQHIFHQAFSKSMRINPVHRIYSLHECKGLICREKNHSLISSITVVFWMFGFDLKYSGILCCICEKLHEDVNVELFRHVFESVFPPLCFFAPRLLREAAHLWCVLGWTFGPYCPSCCLLSQITFWHSSLLSQTMRWLWPKASGGPNDKASLTISKQKQGGEWRKLNCQGEKRGKEECRRGGWYGEREGGGGLWPHPAKWSPS